MAEDLRLSYEGDEGIYVTKDGDIYMKNAKTGRRMDISLNTPLTPRRVREIRSEWDNPDEYEGLADVANKLQEKE